LGSTSAGGYSDKRFSEDTFHVRFAANNNTQSRTICNYLYQRAAELTLENGFKYFAIIKGPSQLARQTHIHASGDAWKDAVEPMEAYESNPGCLHMTIQCFKETQEAGQMRLIDAKMCLQKHIRQR